MMCLKAFYKKYHRNLLLRTVHFKTVPSTNIKSLYLKFYFKQPQTATLFIDKCYSIFNHLQGSFLYEF